MEKKERERDRRRKTGEEKAEQMNKCFFSFFVFQVMFWTRYSWCYILCETWIAPEHPLNFVWSNSMGLVGEGIAQDF